jgi:hypothetical protein
MPYADYKAISKKDVMKSKPLLLALLSTISITGIVYASAMSNCINTIPILVHEKKRLKLLTL